MKKSNGWRVLALLFTLSIGLPLEPVYAHAQLVKSDPGRRIVIKTTPKQIRLWFSEKLEPAYSSMTVLDQSNRAVTTKAASVSPDDPKLLLLPLDALAPGVYTVQYRVLSVDGHIVESSFTFTFKPTQ